VKARTGLKHIKQQNTSVHKIYKTIMKKLVLSLFVLALTATTVFGQAEAKFKKIDSLLNYFYANNKFMGAIAIREGNKVVFEKAYGFADAENKVKAAANTKYKIGSITKMFTSAIIFQLIEEKKLTLDTKLSVFYPQIKNADKITISNLLNHSSGIFNFTSDPGFTSFNTIHQTKEMMLNRLAGYKADFDPGAKAEYSNSNYMLLGYIIEDITKKPYKESVAERVVKKAGLKNTYYYGAIDPKKNEAFSYSFNGKAWEKREQWEESLVFAAGALQSTPADLTQFIKALFDGKIIKKESLAEMTKMEHGYGRGIFNFPFGERKFFGHNGGIEGFTSVLGYYPKEDMSFSLTVNGDNYDANDIVIGILSGYYKLPYRFPNLKTVSVDEAVLKSYEGTYASPTVPLKLTLKVVSGQLTAQATGQGPFPLNAVSPTEFIFDAAGIKVKFKSSSVFTIEQGGSLNEFTKEK
jgi:CubicO group peptidase (beta-lactamase class C family)